MLSTCAYVSVLAKCDSVRVACGDHITAVICECDCDRSQRLRTVVIAAQMDVHAETDQVV